jgi:hypothetical protein
MSASYSMRLEVCGALRPCAYCSGLDEEAIKLRLESVEVERA